MDDARRLLERIDERTLALREGVERIMEMTADHENRLVMQESIRESLLGNDFAGLRRVISGEIDQRLASRGMSAREWLNAGVGLVAVVVALLAHFQ